MSLLLWLFPSLLMAEWVRRGCCCSDIPTVCPWWGKGLRSDPWEFCCSGCGWRWCKGMDRLDEEEEEVDEGEPMASETGWNMNPCLLTDMRAELELPTWLWMVEGEDWLPPTDIGLRPAAKLFKGDLWRWDILVPKLFDLVNDCWWLLASKLLLEMLKIDYNINKKQTKQNKKEILCW